jgi:hypothetical protein
MEPPLASNRLQPVRWCQRIAILLPLGLITLAGCSSGPPQEPVFPVKGTLFVDDKPAHGAVVWFFPLDVAEVDVKNPAADPRPSGIVQADGTFELNTFGSKDGAPAGRYRIGVSWTKTLPGDNEEQLLPSSFMDPDKAGLPVVEVRSAPNLLPPFSISSR